MLAIATTLSIIPVIGSQGVGTMDGGARHADRALFGGSPASIAVLADADAAVAAALARATPRR